MKAKFKILRANKDKQKSILISILVLMKSDYKIKIKP